MPSEPSSPASLSSLLSFDILLSASDAKIVTHSVAISIGSSDLDELHVRRVRSPSLLKVKDIGSKSGRITFAHGFSLS